MKRHIVTLLSVVGMMGAVPAVAGDCFADPVYRYSGSGTIASAVFMRNEACMQGSSILATVPTGAVVQVLGFTDGWYSISWNGGRGWVGQQFVASGASKTGATDSYSGYMGEYPSVAPSGQSKPVTSSFIDPSLVTRLKGYILLQTQSHGEAWYVDPQTAKRYYMKDGPTAYQMMRRFGLGITDADLAKLQAGNATLLSQLRGRIVLQVQAHGEAYYIHPKTGSVTYLKDGEAAYSVLRTQSLGITNADLEKIPSGSL
ncbi:MAG TPA: SH3 domain-containing protein [Candidatus Methylomirabilis sp.]|nr:SH3 domain-containing protein [Candidatus Methylomirabilis sp.]